MKTLLLTITVLMLLSIFTYSSLKRFMDGQAIQIGYLKQVQLLRDHQNEAERLRYEWERDNRKRARPVKDIAKEGGEERPKQEEAFAGQQRKRVNLATAGDKGKLNFGVILKGNPDEPFYAIAAALIRRLYADEAFFEEVPNAEYRILNTLIDKEALASSGSTEGFEGPISKVEELGSIYLDDPQLHRVFYKMLKGTRQTGKGYPSLLDYVVIDKSRKIRFHYASLKMLQAVFQDDALVDDLLRKRAEVTAQEQALSESKEEKGDGALDGALVVYTLLEDEVRAILSAHGADLSRYLSILDFSL